MKISLAVYNKRNRHYFNLKLKYEVLIYISFAWCRRIFKNHNFNALKLLFKNLITARRIKCCGRTVVAHGCWKTKKGNMWHGRGKSGGLWPPASPRSYGTLSRESYSYKIREGIDNIWWLMNIDIFKNLLPKLLS